MQYDSFRGRPIKFKAASQSLIKVLVAYEDFRIGQWTKRLFDRLQCRMEPGRFLSVLLWKFDVLRFSQLRDIAADDADEAQLIVFAVHKNAGVPPFVKAWIRQWLPRKNNHPCATLVLVQEPNDSGATGDKLESYLQEAALGAGVDIVVHTGSLFSIDSDASVDDALAMLGKVVFVSEGPARSISLAAG